MDCLWRLSDDKPLVSDTLLQRAVWAPAVLGYWAVLKDLMHSIRYLLESYSDIQMLSEFFYPNTSLCLINLFWSHQLSLCWRICQCFAGDEKNSCYLLPSASSFWGSVELETSRMNFCLFQQFLPVAPEHNSAVAESSGLGKSWIWPALYQRVEVMLTGAKAAKCFLFGSCTGPSSSTKIRYFH